MSERSPKYQYWTPEIEQRYVCDALEHHGVVSSVYDSGRQLRAGKGVRNRC